MILLSVFIQIESIYTPTVLIVTVCKNFFWDLSQEMDFYFVTETQMNTEHKNETDRPLQLIDIDGGL